MVGVSNDYIKIVTNTKYRFRNLTAVNKIKVLFIIVHVIFSNVLNFLMGLLISWFLVHSLFGPRSGNLEVVGEVLCPEVSANDGAV